LVPGVKKSDVFFLGSKLVDQEGMWPVGDFSWLRSMLWVPCSALTQLMSGRISGM